VNIVPVGSRRAIVSPPPSAENRSRIPIRPSDRGLLSAASVIPTPLSLISIVTFPSVADIVMSTLVARACQAYFSNIDGH
jgi:hypothetical protein